jgi:hypothetical protein
MSFSPLHISNRERAHQMRIVSSCILFVVSIFIHGMRVFADTISSQKRSTTAHYHPAFWDMHSVCWLQDIYSHKLYSLTQLCLRCCACSLSLSTRASPPHSFTFSPKLNLPLPSLTSFEVWQNGTASPFFCFWKRKNNIELRKNKIEQYCFFNTELKTLTRYCSVRLHPAGSRHARS